MNEFSENRGEELSPREKREAHIKKNMAELAHRKESGELEKVDFDIYDFTFRGPLTREILGNRAVVLSKSDLEELGGFLLMVPDGDTRFIDPEEDVANWGPGDLLIIFPEDLGNPEE
jgi:hypothetical protein